MGLNNQKKLLIFHPATVFGGAERFLSWILPHMVREFQIILLSTAPFLTKVLLPPEIKVVSIDHLSSFRPKDPRLTVAILRILKDNPCDLSLIFLISHLIIPFIILQRVFNPRCKINLRYCGPWYSFLNRYKKGEKRRCLRVFLKLSDRLATKIISPSRGVKEEIVHYSRIKEKKVVLVRPVIDVSRIQHLIRHGPPVALSRPAIIWAGRLSREKDPGLMILAMKEVLKHRRAHLYIFGTGASERRCRRVVSRLGLEHHIHFMGFKKNIFRFMAAGDIFVHTCHIEAFGFSMVEAMACGLPVIAENCPYGPGEILEGGKFGLLVQRDQGELSRAIITLIDDEGKRNHYKKCSLDRSWSFNIDNDYKELWLQVLQ